MAESSQSPSSSFNAGTNIESDAMCQEILNNSDFYSILGLTKDCNEEEIKRAYKKLIVKVHPDKNKSEHAHEAFKKVSLAYQTVSDPKKRELYDQFGTADEQKISDSFKNRDMDEFDLFDLIFNQQNMRGAQRRRNHVNRNEQLTPKQKLTQLVFPLLFFIIFYILPMFTNPSSKEV